VTTIDPDLRRIALARAEEIGPNEAARELGLKPATVRKWRERAGASSAEVSSSGDPWADRHERAALRSWDTALQALTVSMELLKSGRTRDAKDAALTFAINVDKSGMLEERAKARRSSRVSELSLEDLDAEIARLSAQLPEPESPPSLPVVEGVARKVEPVEEPESGPRKRRFRKTRERPSLDTEPPAPVVVLPPRDKVAESHWEERGWRRFS
jgi:hypothetical protein